MSQVWMVRAGDEGRLIDTFREGVIAVEYDRLGDMTSATNLRDIQAAYRAAYPDATRNTITIRTGVFYKFRVLLGAAEDSVITYDPEKREYLVGTITGDYHYREAAETCKHQRRVTWKGAVQRDLLSTAAKDSLQSQLAIFKVADAVWQEMERLMEPLEGGGRVFFAFLEEYVVTPTSVIVVFDAMSASQFERVAHAEKPEALAAITPVQFTLHARDEKLRAAVASAMKKEALRHWFRLEMVDDGEKAKEAPAFQMSLWRNDGVTGFAHVSVAPCEADTESRLNAVFNLAHFGVDEKDAILRIIDAVGAKSGDACHVAYNVGQGSCSALHRCLQGTQSLYFDVGAGHGLNKETYPGDVTFQPAEDAVVVLSHWHKDHWSAAERIAPHLKKLTWITPFQHPIGVSAMKLAAEVRKEGKLVVWGNDKKRGEVVENTLLRLVKLPDRLGDTDESGIVVALTTHMEGASFVTVIPGDAPYESFLSYVRDLQIGALHVPAHGGESAGEPPVASPFVTKLVYSYGKNNCYGHPAPEVVARHIEKRWLNKKETVNGKVLVAPFSCPLTACSAEVEQA